MTKPEKLFFSIVVPVYNRPQEVAELLADLVAQTCNDFEVIVVEDGSAETCKAQVAAQKGKLDIHYFYKEKSGPGSTRNYGCERAKGNYYILLDSDCVLPSHYIETLYKELDSKYADAFGGPDKARKDFSVFQRAISHSMTSLLTTGGVRGASEKMQKFYPKSFNMGYSRKVFEVTKGFSSMPIGEDTDLSIRIFKAHFTVRLIKEAFVYHKRRTSLKKFAKQVYIFGKARFILYTLYPETLRWVHIIPAVFTAGVLLSVVLSVALSGYFLLLIVLFALLFFVEAFATTGNLSIALVAIATGFTQLVGYGVGLLSACWRHVVLGKKP